MSTITYPLTGLHCQACVRRVTEKLAPLAGHVAVTLQPMQVVLTDPQAAFGALQSAVAAAGAYSMAPALQEKLLTDSANAQSLAKNNMASEAAAESAGWLSTYRPLLLIVGYILGASLLTQTAHDGAASISLEETMRYFMAGFFLVFSFFKLLDIRAFADAYAGYDLLARRWHSWGLIYPFIELALGAAYLAHVNPALTHWITVAVMGFSAIGVIQAVSSKKRIQCACLGAVFKLPMSTVTIVEDLGMVVMALWMLAIAGQLF